MVRLYKAAEYIWNKIVYTDICIGHTVFVYSQSLLSLLVMSETWQN